jgi:serine-type D-Ala-D-Ala carboxypeptidase (penicillin-binding protein 5/6)
MKKIIFGFLVISFVLVSFFAAMLIPSNKKFNLLSPLPNFLTFTKNSQASTLDIWEFDLNNKVAEFNPPNISATSALVYDLTSKKTIFAKNPKKKLPFASLTKIMTSIVALENKKNNDKYVVKETDLVGEDSMGLKAGENLSLKELLYGLLLHSGNDAAEVIANNFSQGREAFIKNMNEKAKSLGISDTNFTNPTGLEGDGNQYSTVYDLVVMTRFALENFPLFADIVKTPEYIIEKTSSHSEYILENETNLLTTYPGVKGVKTGYTTEAGLCLVTYLEYDGHKIIAVLLNSENRRDDMKQLLDYSLKIQSVVPPKHS